jgi:NTP pyrophosphatase (non-canonical NTP hydrolase)
MKSITFTPDQENVFIDAITLYGEGSQLTQTNEECTELSLAILKYKRTLGEQPVNISDLSQRRKDLLSEIADVIIMTQQCVLLFGAEEIQAEVNYKLRRQRARIDKRIKFEINKKLMTGFPKIEQ